MCRILLLSLGVVMIVAGEPSKDLLCVHKAVTCCNTDIGQDKKYEEIKDCFKGSPNMHSCDVDICVGQKLGYGKSDGTFIKEAFVRNLEDMIYKNGTDCVELIKKNCIDGDISMYGEKEFCEIKKVQICSFVQYVKICDDWKDNDRCKGAEEAAAECIKDFN